jgi:predicted permease
MKILRQLRSFFRRQKLDAEMSEEMRTHLDLQTERHIAAGMNSGEARYRAFREFGNIASIQEQAREGRGWIWLENSWREVLFALRSLRRAPGFSLAVIFTFALCLGPNAAIFDTLYVLVLKPQPFREPDRIVRIYNAFEKVGGSVSRQDSSIPQYRDFKDNADLFSDFAIMRYTGTSIGEETMLERAFGMRVNAGFFEFFGVKPVIGRFGTRDEDAVGHDHVLVLAERFWRSRYNGDSNMIGRSIRIDGEPWTIIGVAPRSLEVLDIHTQFFKPFEPVPDEVDANARYTDKVVLFGRMKPGVSRTMALEQLSTIDRRFIDHSASLQLRNNMRQAGQRIVLGEVGTQTSSIARTPLSLLQMGAAFVLLIGVVNVANLMLARANARRPELAIRLALGAGPGVLMRQLLAESLLLTFAATATGIGLAWASLKVINLVLNQMAWISSPIAMDPMVIAAIAMMALGLGIVIGVLPFLSLWRAGLKLETRTASSGSAMRRLSSVLVVTQMAVALMLLIGAGLLIRSFTRVMAIDPGFDTEHIVQGRVAVPRPYDDPQRNVAFQQQLLAAMKEIPGVTHASIVADYAVTATFRSFSFILRDAPADTDQKKPLANWDMVSTEFFPTMNIRLLEGRLFTEADNLSTAPVVIVDELFVRRYFPNRSPLGEEISLGMNRPPDGVPWPRIVGVVQRAQLAGLEERDGLPFVYAPMNQRPSPGFTLVVSSSRPTGDMLAAMRQKLHQIDPSMPLYSAGSLQGAMDDMLLSRHMMMSLTAIFAALAVLIAAVGLYGVLAYDVSQRTREIGIRGAIGASRRQIVGMILRQGMRKTSVGLAVGLFGGFYVTQLLRGQLFDVQPFDPVTFVGVPVLLLLVAVLASWLPARRAAKVDPVIALRAE